MNHAADVEIKIRTATRHSYLKKAKELLKKNDPQYQFFAELAEREQVGIEKFAGWYPGCQL